MTPSGIITLDDECNYVISNGPFMQRQTKPNLDIVLQNNIEDEDISRPNDSILGEHFEEYDNYYIIGLETTHIMASCSLE